MIYGYARVSTDGQSVAAQVKELRDAGAEKVFREPARGAQTDRAQLRWAFDKLDTDDVLIVTRLDRVARSCATCSIPMPRSPTRARASVPLATHGQTPPRRMGA